MATTQILPLKGKRKAFWLPQTNVLRSPVLINPLMVFTEAIIIIQDSYSSSSAFEILRENTQLTGPF